MIGVTLGQIKQKELNIRKMLEGRDPQDINLPEELKKDMKRYEGLIKQYNACALTTACVQPYINKFFIKDITRIEFKTQFEKKRYETLSCICAVRPTKIHELLSEISQNSRSIFKIAVDPAIENLLLHLNEEHNRNLMICDPLDNFEASRLSI